MKFLLAFILSLFFSQAFAGCFPQNSLRISPNLKSINGIDESQFMLAVEDMKKLYGPIFEKDYGATLNIIADWKDETVNAYAQQSGKNWQVNMFGGLARHAETTLDGFRAVICHEIGHHVAGAPKKGWSWAANEGQSDYFATTKCLRKFYVQDLQRNETIALYKKSKNSFNDEENFAKQKCQEVYKSTLDRAACFRSSLAGKSLARLLGSLGGNAEVVFTIPDPSVVTKTNHNHPKAQCRMDTYFQGALCVNDADELSDPTDVRKGYCTAIDKFEVGLRPACWYKASEYEK